MDNSMPVMSFVTAVLATAGRLDKDDLNTKLSQLSRKIDEVKLEVHDAMIKKYEEFYPLLDSTRHLRDRVTVIHNDMETLASTIEKQLKAQLQISAGDYESLLLKYEENKAILALLHQLIEISDGFQLVSHHTSTNNYVEATRSLAAVIRTLEGLRSTHGDRLTVLGCLNSHCAWLQANLITSLLKQWHNIVQWKTASSESKDSTEELRISMPGSSLDEITASVQSLHYLGRLEEVMIEFGERLMKNLFVKLLDSRGAISFSDSKEAGVVVISVVQDSAHPRTELEIVSFVQMLFVGLYQRLLKVSVANSATTSEDSKTHTSKSLISIIGRRFASEFAETLIRDCLSRSIPSSRSGLESYVSIIVVVEKLEQLLIEMEFLGENDKTLSDYVNNVEVLFSGKRCQEILEAARMLMKSDIHNIVAVSDEERGILNIDSLSLSEGKKSASSKKAKSQKNATANGVTLDPLFIFPQCHISIAAQKLMRMGYSIMREASSGDDDVPPQTAMQLFYCVRTMFEMFTSIVPVYHREHFVAVPQMAAIYHNDCMYIAHHLMLLGHQFQSGLPEPLCSGAATFIDIIPVLRRSGTKCFLEQLSTQKAQLLQSLQSAQGFVCLSNPDNFESAERAVSQVMLQLRRLVNVWKDVLPSHVYAKSIGTLLNSALTELFLCIINLDDIRELESDLLAGLLADLSDSAQSDILTPIINKHPVAVCKLVPVWGRLAEIKLVLKARLQDIVDRWANGKGPLAAELKAIEVKQLIRALFQNTEKRAAALAAIN